MTADDVVAELRDGMTIGIGGWGSRRKPMSLVRAILRSSLRDLTIVSYGGPDVGHAVRGRQGAQGRLRLRVARLDPARAPLPRGPPGRARSRRSSSTRACSSGGSTRRRCGCRSCRPAPASAPTCMEVNPQLRTVRSPYDDGEELVAMPALPLDVALVHMNRADAPATASSSGPTCTSTTCSAWRPAGAFCPASASSPPTTAARGVGAHAAHQPHDDRRRGRGADGAHFTSCDPDYGRDEAFQKDVRGDASGREFKARYLDVDEADVPAAGERVTA